MSLMESKVDILEEFKHKFVKTFQVSSYIVKSKNVVEMVKVG